VSASHRAHGMRTVKRTKQYIESLLNQTRMWMEGISMHNRITGECCPDFSCCHSDMLTAKPERQTRGQKMLLTFV
jgi:N-acetylmuramoyl-L-alanine amidase CwlA